MSPDEPGNAVYIIYGYYPGLMSPQRAFCRSLRENRSFLEKKREPCLSPHARGLMFWVLILYGVRVFEMFRFFLKTPVVFSCKIGSHTAENEPYRLRTTSATCTAWWFPASQSLQSVHWGTVVGPNRSRGPCPCRPFPRRSSCCGHPDLIILRGLGQGKFGSAKMKLKFE